MEKQSEYQYDVLDMNIMLDHVHLLLDVNPRNTGGIFRIVNNIKGYTSHVLRKEFSDLRNRDFLHYGHDPSSFLPLVP